MKSVSQSDRRSPLRAGGLLAVLLLAGCMYSGWPFHKGQAEPPVDRPVYEGQEPVLDKPDAGRTGETGGGEMGREGLGWKVVSGKREPSFLIARDGTECLVPTKRWEEVIIGAQALCIWGPPK